MIYDIWSNISNFFVNVWEKIIDFFTVSENGELTEGERLVIALIVLVVGWVLIKLLMIGLKKLFHVNDVVIKKKKKLINPKTKKIEIKYVNVDSSLRRFMFSLTSVCLKFLLVIAFFSILEVKIEGLATVISSALLAVGLSLQDSISNFMAGILLLSNKTIAVGDYVSVAGGADGTVVAVSIVSTILDTPDNQRLVVPNRLILANTAKNYSKNIDRRSKIKVRVVFGSDIDKVKDTLINLVKDDHRIIQTIQNKKPMVVLSSIGESSLNFELRFWTKNSYYWNVNFEYNEKVLRAFEKENIQFAFNTVTVVSESNTKDVKVKKKASKKNE